MKRWTLVFVAFLALALATPIAHASPRVPSSSGVLAGAVNASAYAGSLVIPAGSSLASVGPLFPVGLGCATSVKTVSSSAALLTLGALASSGSLTDQATTSRTTTTASVQASANVQAVSVLAGLIRADAVHTVASSDATTTSATSSNGSTFVNLVVAGIPISSTPGPNTTIALPGLGSVVLNEQVGPVNKANHTSISVTAIDIRVTLANLLGLPIGARIVIAHAQTGFTSTSFPAVVGAKAYGLLASASVAPAFIKSGPWATASIGCTGGSSAVSVVGVTVPVIGSTGTITDTATGQITPQGPNASSSSTIQQINILNGTITLDLVAATTQASFIGTGSASATMTLVNATVAGISIAAHPGPNTKIPIAGLGYVIVNEQSAHITSTTASASVNAIDLYVTTSNIFGLPVGVRIIVGHSDVGLTTY